LTKLLQTTGVNFDRKAIQQSELNHLITYSNVPLTSVQVIVVLMLSPLSSRSGLIRQFIQQNLAGSAENFRVVSWKFDPDAAYRRRAEFEEKHGVYGQKLIARLGQGEDGHHEERRRKQIEQDKEAGYPDVNE
jgi:hypothetical protein